MKSKKEDVHNGSDGGSSGKLSNPGKSFFLKLAVDVVIEVNYMKDSNGIGYARKAMIMTSMSLGIDGTWCESQLTYHLPQIVAKHRIHFNGFLVNPEDVETESDSDFDQIDDVVDLR